jgi:hypothetical protein
VFISNASLMSDPANHAIPFSCIPRCSALVQFARGKNDGQDYAIKFFTNREAFEREDALYSNKVGTAVTPAA